MAELDRTAKWNKITGAAFIVSLIASAVVGIFGGLMTGTFTFLVLTGVFMTISFYLRDESRTSGGPSVTDGAMMGGILLAGIGVCGFIYTYTENVMITSICIIVVLVASSMVMIVRNRRFL